MQYKEDSQLIEDIFEYDAVLVPMGINNSMSNRFPYDVKLNFPEVYDEEKKTGYCDKRKYGTVTFAESCGIRFALCHMCLPSNRKRSDMDYVNYKALGECLGTVNERFKGLKVATPILGTSPGRGDSEKVVSVMAEKLSDVYLTIYTSYQRHFPLVVFRQIAELHSRFANKEMTAQEYLRERSRIEWTRRYGIYKEMPEDYSYIPRSISRTD